MELSPCQAWQLRGIERSLRRSEPDMAALLDDFGGLSQADAPGSPAEACSPGNGGWLVLAILGSEAAAAACCLIRGAGRICAWAVRLLSQADCISLGMAVGADPADPQHPAGR